MAARAGGTIKLSPPKNGPQAPGPHLPVPPGSELIGLGTSGCGIQAYTSTRNLSIAHPLAARRVDTARARPPLAESHKLASATRNYRMSEKAGKAGRPPIGRREARVWRV